jgi:hypothetical protein
MIKPERFWGLAVRREKKKTIFVVGSQRPAWALTSTADLLVNISITHYNQ